MKACRRLPIRLTTKAEELVMSNNNGKSRTKEERDAFVAKRREAREQCFAILFEMTFTDDSYQDIIDTAVESRLIVADKFTIKVLEYFTKHRSEIDDVIKANIKGWTFERLSRVPLSVIRLALCEIRCCKTPESVAINEAVELTKKYGAEKEASFVNAVLGAAVRKEDNDNKNEQ